MCVFLDRYLPLIFDPVDPATLARNVVAQIVDESSDEVPKDIVRRVQTWPHHGHLPVLDRYGLVEYDPEKMLVSLPPPGEESWTASCL